MFTQARETTAGNFRSFQFDGVVFHPASGHLGLEGMSVALRPRTAAVLEYLLQHHARLISRDELLSQVWADAVVTEDSLTQCIKEIRKALTPAHAHAVRTVPRVGYQMAVPVATIVDTGEPLPDTPLRPAPHAPGWLTALGAALTLALVVGLMGTAVVRHGLQGTRPPLSILVMPFTDPAQADKASWLGDALSSELTIRLGQTAGVQVISADTARAMRHVGTDPRVAATELGVRYVLSGVVRPVDQRVRLDLVLTDGQTGMQRWAKQIDVERDLVHLTLEELAQQVARSLSLQMHRWSGEATARLSPSQVQADDIAMQGWAIYFRALTPDNLQAAVVLFEDAVSKDPASVRGWGGVAVAHGMAAYTHWAKDRPAAITRLQEAVSQLENLDAEGLYTHVGRSLAAHIAADWEAVLVINSVGVERFPGHSPSHYARAMALTRLGRFEECLLAAQQALRIGPRDHQAGAYHLQAGFCHFHLGDFPQAARQARLAQEFSPRLDMPWLLLAASLSQAGNLEGAQQVIADFKGRRPAFQLSHASRLLQGNNERFVQGRAQFLQALSEMGMQ